MGMEDLAAYLVLGGAQQKAIADDDPYSGGASLGNSLMQSVLQDTVQRPEASSMKERIALAALTGLGGGLFGGLSNDYRARASDAYQDTVANTIMGKEVEAPSVLSSSIFSDARQRGSIFKIQQALEQQKFDRELKKLTDLENVKSRNDFEKGVLLEVAKNPYRAEKILGALGMQPSARAATQPIGGPVSDSGANMEQALERFGGDEAMAREYLKSTDPTLQQAQLDAKRKEKEMLLELERVEKGTTAAPSIAFVAKQFDDAKELGSIAAGISGSTAANEMAGIQTNLRTKLQAMLGREMNGPEQEKLMAALPDWNDTAAQIEAKKARFLELINSVSNVGQATQTKGPPAVDQAARARAILKARGVAGY